MMSSPNNKVPSAFRPPEEGSDSPAVSRLSPQLPKSGTGFKVGLGVALTLVIGGLAAFIVFVLTRDGGDDGNGGNISSPIIYFEGKGMGFIRMSIESNTQKKLCVTHYENGSSDSDFLLLECAPQDKLWLLEQQVFYHVEDTHQIVSNADGRCVTWTPPEGLSSLYYSIGVLQLMPCRSSNPEVDDGEDADESLVLLAQQQWYSFVDSNGNPRLGHPRGSGASINTNNNDDTMVCWTMKPDSVYDDYKLDIEDCFQDSLERQIVQVPDQFWDPPAPSGYAQPVLPGMTGALQSVVQVVADVDHTNSTVVEKCITYYGGSTINKTWQSTSGSNVGLEPCHYGDNQLFVFREESLQWQLSSGEGCLERKDNSALAVAECLGTINVNIDDATINKNDTSTTYVLDMDTTLEDQRNGGVSNLLKENNDTQNDDSSLLVSEDHQKRQQWYYDRQGRIYNYPRDAATSFCLGMKAPSSSVNHKNNIDGDSSRKRRRYLKRMSGGGGGGSSSSSSGGGSSSSGGSGGGSSSSSSSSSRPSRPYLGSSSGSSSSSSSSSGSFTSGTVAAGGTRNVASTEGYPSTFRANSNTGAFRSSHPSYAARPTDSYYVARNRLYFARDNRIGHSLSEQPTPAPGEVVSNSSLLQMDECRFQFSGDIEYDNQRFSFIPRSGVLRNGTGSIRLGTSNDCLTLTDDMLWGNQISRFILRVEPCNENSNQSFTYHSESGQLQGTGYKSEYGSALQGTGALTGSCLSAIGGSIVTVFMSFCDASGYLGIDSHWIQDSQGRLVSQANEIENFCLTSNGTEATLESCQDGANQMVFWEPTQQLSDAPSVFPPMVPSSSPSTPEGATPNSNQHAVSMSPSFPQPTTNPLSYIVDGSVFFELESTNNPGITNRPSGTPLPENPVNPVTRAPSETPAVTLRPIPLDTGRGNIFGRPLSTPGGDS